VSEQIIGFIGEHKLYSSWITTQRKLRRGLAWRLAKKYYNSKSIYISGLRPEAETIFVEFVNFLHLDWYACLAFQDQILEYDRANAIKFKRLLKMAIKQYNIWTLPDYKIKKKEKEEFDTKYRLINEYYNRVNKFVIDQSDVCIMLWNGKRVGSGVYKSINYAKEQDKGLDLIHISTKKKGGGTYFSWDG